MSTGEEALSAWRIENAEPVRCAIALIKPEVQWQDACRDDVEMALIDIELTDGQLRANTHRQTKPAKLAARRLANALRRVEAVLKHGDLDITIGLFFPRDELIRWTKHCDELVKTPSGKLKRKSAEAKRLAVSEAHLLMRRYGPPDAAKNTRKGSRFCRLASCLYGQPKADLHNQCRAALRKKRGSK